MSCSGTAPLGGHEEIRCADLATLEGNLKPLPIGSRCVGAAQRRAGRERGDGRERINA